MQFIYFGDSPVELQSGSRDALRFTVYPVNIRITELSRHTTRAEYNPRVMPETANS